MAIWQTKRIGEIATIKPPKSEAREQVSADALVSFLPMEDLGIAIKYSEPKQTKKLSEVVGSYTHFAEGDVLLAKITPCFENGKPGIAKGLKTGIGFGSSEFIVLRPDNSVSNEWLSHFLSREDFRTEGAQRMGGAVGQQRVPKESVEAYEIPAPPLPEQQRITPPLSPTSLAEREKRSPFDFGFVLIRAIRVKLLCSLRSLRLDKRLSVEC